MGGRFWGACPRGAGLVLAVALAGGPVTTSRAVAASSAAAPPIRHVFVINLENEGFDQTFGPNSPARYLTQTLTKQGELLTQYFAIGHASLPNYIAEISGQGPNPDTQGDCATYREFQATGTGDLGQALGQGCVYPASITTVADQLGAAHRTWKSYQEDIANSPADPKTCRHPPIGASDSTVVARVGDQYATRHNPFVYFHSVIDSAACDKSVVGLDHLRADLASARTTPNLAFITPNLCHDGHDAPCVDGQPGGLVSADQFLRTWVPKITKSSAFHHDGVLIVTTDEAQTNDTSACCGVQSTPNAAQPGLTCFGRDVYNRTK
jgi:phospholipase C